MWFKACPRCGGDLYLRDNIDSEEVVCIQCSHVLREEEKLISSLQKQEAEQAGTKAKVA